MNELWDSFVTFVDNPFCIMVTVQYVMQSTPFWMGTNE